MGKKYLLVEVEEERSYSDDGMILDFLFFMACLVFPPLMMILYLKKVNGKNLKYGK